MNKLYGNKKAKNGSCCKGKGQRKGLTSPIRFSRHSMTELLVAAEQTASFFPWKTVS